MQFLTFQAVVWASDDVQSKVNLSIFKVVVSFACSEELDATFSTTLLSLSSAEDSFSEELELSIT